MGSSREILVVTPASASPTPAPVVGLVVAPVGAAPVVGDLPPSVSVSGGSCALQLPPRDMQASTEQLSPARSPLALQLVLTGCKKGLL